MKTVIYKRKNKSIGLKLDRKWNRVKIWRPTIFKWTPPGKSNKYIIYWLFHYLHIFSNRNYSAYIFYKDDEIISSFLAVPRHFMWPFMDKNDIQFTYVMTAQNFRGMGIAMNGIQYAMINYKEKIDNFWYVTDEQNSSSINLAKKLGFTFYSNGKRGRIIRKLTLVKTD